jgi:hypothetical protein
MPQEAITIAEGDIAYSNISATQSTFFMASGQYGIDAVATWGGGTVVLQKLAGDASTYVTVQSFSANGFEIVTVPAGTYRIAVTTATGVYVKIGNVVNT